jgi:hypothetical protein
MRTNYIRRKKVMFLISMLFALSFACCNSDSTKIEVTPWTKHIITDTFNAKDLFTGDIDGDGKEEFVAIDPMDQREFSWFDHELVEGEHRWTEHSIDETFLPADFELQDVDEDGDLDILMAGQCTAGEIEASNEACLESLMFWFENVDGGTVWEKHVIGEMGAIGANYIASGDMDGDGDLDVAVTTSWMPIDPEYSEVAWFRNNLNQGSPWDKTIISPPDSSGIQFTNGITISDLDRDGHPDVGVAVAKVLEEFGTVYWFKAPSIAGEDWQRFQVDPGMETAAFSIFAYDVNHDGYDDLVAGRNDSHRGPNPGGTIFYINPRNPEEGGEWEQYAFEEGDYKMGPYLNFDDINSDGKLDIMSTYTWDLPGDPASVSWIEFHFNPICGLVQERRVIIDTGPLYSWDVHTIDLYGDGKKSIVVSAFDKPNIVCYEQP